jgi:hypothetical protein
MNNISIFGRWEPAPDEKDTSYSAIRKVIKGQMNVPVYIWFDGEKYTTNAEFLDEPYSFETLDECKMFADRNMKEAGCMLCNSEGEEEKVKLLL